MKKFALAVTTLPLSSDQIDKLRNVHGVTDIVEIDDVTRALWNDRSSPEANASELRQKNFKVFKEVDKIYHKTRRGRHPPMIIVTGELTICKAVADYVEQLFYDDDVLAWTVTEGIHFRQI